MKKEKLRLTLMLPVVPSRIYAAWLNSREHSAFTGGEAVISARKGAAFTAWDGYISGKNLELEKDKRILQSWRAEEFAAADEDSLLELLFEKSGNGTKLTLIHSNIPAGLGKSYQQGWKDYYFTPMKAYFAG